MSFDMRPQDDDVHGECSHEITALRLKVERQVAEIYGKDAKILSLTAEIESLKRVVEVAYLQFQKSDHIWNCSYRKPIELGRIALPCDCGLDYALSEIRAGRSLKKHSDSDSI